MLELIDKGYPKGIKVELSKGLLKKSKPAQEDIFYWDIGAQNVIIASLGDYLPRVSEDRQKNFGLFSKFRKKTELCSSSKALDERGVAKEEKIGLLRGLEKLEEKSKDPRIDPNAKLILENFKLPDPEKLPEFYRLSEGRLMIIWGCETHPTDSLRAKEAVQKLKVDPWHKIFIRRAIPFLRRALSLLWPLLALIILLLLLLSLNDCSKGFDGKDLVKEVEEFFSGENNYTDRNNSSEAEYQKGNQRDASREDNKQGTENSQGEAEEGKGPKTTEGEDGPQRQEVNPSPEAYKIWLPLKIDTNNYHATTLVGIYSKNKDQRIFLAEPGDNSIYYNSNEHQFSPKVVKPTVGKLGRNKNYFFYDLLINNEKRRFYIFGLLHFDLNELGSPLQQSDEILVSPDLSQNKYGFWKSLCAPTAVSNLIWFLSSTHSPSQRINLNPINIFSDQISRERLVNQFKKQVFASDLLIAGDQSNKYHESSLASLMGSTENGTSVDGIINGTLNFLNQHDPELSWASEIDAFQSQTDLWSALTQKINMPHVLFVKLNTPPENNNPCISCRIFASTNNSPKPTKESGSIDIVVNPGSEMMILDKEVSVELMLKDTNNPKEKFDITRWYLYENATDKISLGNSSVMDFTNSPGTYIIGAEGKTFFGGKSFTIRKGIRLDFIEAKKVSPKVEIFQAD